MTKKSDGIRLAPLESVIMDGIWEVAPASVKDVQERIRKKRKLAYNTVLTVMRRMRDKGILKSSREGRFDIYEPTISKEQSRNGHLSDLLQRFYAGNARALVSQLLDSECLTGEDIKQLRGEVDKALRALPKQKGGK